jgi:hypothetical protein
MNAGETVCASATLIQYFGCLVPAFERAVEATRLVPAVDKCQRLRRFGSSGRNLPGWRVGARLAYLYLRQACILNSAYCRRCAPAPRRGSVRLVLKK